MSTSPKSFSSWFLLQFKPNASKLAERNLTRQNCETFLPVQEITSRKSAQFYNNLTPLFPGYMFISLDLTKVSWHKINNTRGVSRIVSFGGCPKPVPDSLVSGLMQRCDKSNKFLSGEKYYPGDNVEIITGPFTNFIASVEEIDADKRVWLLMELMGQINKISVTPEQLKKTNQFIKVLQ